MRVGSFHILNMIYHIMTSCYVDIHCSIAGVCLLNEVDLANVSGRINSMRCCESGDCLGSWNHILQIGHESESYHVETSKIIFSSVTK